MTVMRHVTWIGLLVLVGATPACRPGGAEVHIIPEGFVGPVVIVYGVPDGEEVNRDDDGTTVYGIPANGLLFVNRPPPKPGWYRMTYVVIGKDGVHELPHEPAATKDPSRLQILGRANGNAPRDVGKIAFVTYFVGIPNQQPNWGGRLERRLDEAIAEAVSLLKSVGRAHSP